MFVRLTGEGKIVEEPVIACPTTGSGYAVFIGKDVVGAGARELGYNLMKMALYTLAQGDSVPAYVLFMNDGVKLPAGEEQQVIDSLMTLLEKGSIILVCGTCLNYYELADRLKVGTVSNMYDIMSAMQRADKVITL
jgi:selenium metabolism protein YedF